MPNRKVAVQVVPHVNPLSHEKGTTIPTTGQVFTVPLPVPVLFTVKVAPGLKVAIQDLDTGIENDKFDSPLLPQLLPLQPANTEPGPG
jgi:hypothetical protein